MKDGKEVPAGGAGSHFDPDETGSHSFPWSSDGHLGDLPAIYVDDNGMATMPVHAPLLTIDDLQNKALMLHEGGDNYSDDPKKLGGGGSRVACGVTTQ